MTRVVRADARLRTSRDGIESWHCFSVGSHYDPDNVAHGALVGVDEHVIAPGSGFDWHPHRGVTILSWVLSGTLRHEQGTHPARVVGPGDVLVQVAGDGIRHRETNASDEPLRLLQTTITSVERTASTTVAVLPVDVAGARFDVVRDRADLDAARWHGWVASGRWRVGTDDLGPGDSVRGSGRVHVTGSGELVILAQS
jgi:quercetin 2,3-dioxygenase